MNPDLSMKEYIGMNTLTSSPFRFRAGESDPITSASPPDFEKGTASLVTIRIFIREIMSHPMAESKGKKAH